MQECDDYPDVNNEEYLNCEGEGETLEVYDVNH